MGFADTLRVELRTSTNGATVGARTARTEDQAIETPERLFALAYAELHRIASQQRRRVGESLTLNTTALVHEGYLKLPPQSETLDRAHFLSLTARAMRQVLIDHARSRVCLKRGGLVVFTEINEEQSDASGDMADMLALDQCLSELSRLDPRSGQVVEWHVFGGLRLEEIAELSGLAVRTTYRDWRRARAFLVQQLGLTNRSLAHDDGH